MKTINQKDRSYYKMGELFYMTKNALAFAMIQKIAHKYTLHRINEMFEPVWNESFDLVATFGKAKDISQRYKRYFMHQDNVLKDRDGKFICVCNQWSKDNLPAFIKFYTDKFDVKITKYKR